MGTIGLFVPTRSVQRASGRVVRSSPTSRWKHDVYGTLKLVNGGQCGDTLGSSMVLQPWASSVYWVQEASILVVYPSTDKEVLACQIPHYLVSVKQGSHASVIACYTEPQDGEICRLSPNSYGTSIFQGLSQ